MRRVLLALAAIAAAETVAFACSCVAPPDNPVELRRLAAEGMNDAVALAEIEALTNYAPGGAETAKVVRLLGGSAPGTFRIQRGEFASSASCDVTYQAGDRDVVILYRSRQASADALPVLRTSGLCASGLIDQPAFRNEVIRLLVASERPGERG